MQTDNLNPAGSGSSMGSALMPEPTEGTGGTYRARPVQTVTVTDRGGRKITIRRLTALDRLRTFEALGSKLCDNMLYVSYALSAVCVVAINGEQVSFPSSKLFIEALVSKLDEDGIHAATAAHKEHFEAGETGDPDAIKKS